MIIGRKSEHRTVGVIVSANQHEQRSCLVLSIVIRIRLLRINCPSFASPLPPLPSASSPFIPFPSPLPPFPSSISPPLYIISLHIFPLSSPFSLPLVSFSSLLSPLHPLSLLPPLFFLLPPLSSLLTPLASPSSLFSLLLPLSSLLIHLPSFLTSFPPLTPPSPLLPFLTSFSHFLFPLRHLSYPLPPPPPDPIPPPSSPLSPYSKGGIKSFAHGRRTHKQ